MAYSIHIASSAERQFKKLPVTLQERLEKKILALADQPRPHGSEKLQGTDYYRIRIGDYRLIYGLNDRE